MVQALEINFGKGLREDVGSVLFRGNACYRKFTGEDLFAREMIFDADVLGVGVPYMVFCETRGCVVVAKESSRRGR